ncbi:MAG: hypothetical protein ACYDEV_17325 [Acidiferrobacter sp.]
MLPATKASETIKTIEALSLSPDASPLEIRRITREIGSVRKVNAALGATLELALAGITEAPDSVAQMTDSLLAAFPGDSNVLGAAVSALQMSGFWLRSADLYLRRWRQTREVTHGLNAAKNHLALGILDTAEKILSEVRHAYPDQPIAFEAQRMVLEGRRLNLQDAITVGHIGLAERIFRENWRNRHFGKKIGIMCDVVAEDEFSARFYLTSVLIPLFDEKDIDVIADITERFSALEVETYRDTYPYIIEFNAMESETIKNLEFA